MLTAGPTPGIGPAERAGAAEWPHVLRPARGEPEGMLLLLHGRGTSELDMTPLIDELDPAGRLIGIAPRAPLELPPGGYHWYRVPEVGFPDPATFLATLEALTGWVDGLAGTFGVPLRRTVIGGFSMGAVMSYAISLGRGRPEPAGVIALSGFIPTVAGFELDLDDRAGFSLAIGHGIRDPIISVEFARDSRRRLERAGADVLYREAPMQHQVEPAMIHVLQSWIPAALAGNERRRVDEA